MFSYRQPSFFTEKTHFLAQKRKSTFQKRFLLTSHIFTIFVNAYVRKNVNE